MARMEHGRTVMQNREDDDMVELDTSLASVCPDSLLGGICELPHCKSSSAERCDARLELYLCASHLG
jgi:hypothetical protein